MKTSKIVQFTACVLLSSSFLIYAMDESIELYHDEARQVSRLVGQPDTPLESFKKLGIPCSPPIPPAEREKIKPEYSLSSKMSAPKFQGYYTLTCATFGAVACLEYGSPKYPLSEGQVAKLASIKYYGVCNPEKRGGMWLSQSMAYARDEGVVEAAKWPYDPESFCCKKTPDKFDTFSRVRFDKIFVLFKEEGIGLLNKKPRTCKPAPDNCDDYPKVPDLNAIKFALLQGNPVAIDIPIFYDNQRKMVCGWGDGKLGISVPTESEVNTWVASQSQELNRGYHVVTLTGYNDKTKTFDFKNSWGSKWGLKKNPGYSTLPYDYVCRFARTAMYGVKKPTAAAAAIRSKL